MLALYRSGRQADALAAYRSGRAAMVEQLGIEPYPAMQELEQAILRQDPALDLGQPGAVERSILVAAFDATRLDGLGEIADTLARRSRRTLILTRPIAPMRTSVTQPLRFKHRANGWSLQARPLGWPRSDLRRRGAT